MTPNPAIQPSFSSEHRNAARSAGGRWKAGAAPSLVPLRQIEVGGNPKVHLDGISLSYKTNDGKQLLALDNIDLKVQPGEFLCIVGPSGCGKSTLLHLIAGLHKPTAGQVLAWNAGAAEWEPMFTSTGTVTNVTGGVGLVGACLGCVRRAQIHLLRARGW